MKLILLTFIFLLSGCSATTPYKVIDYNVPAKPGTRSTIVKWIVVDDVDKVCRQLNTVASTKILGCSRWTKDHSLCEIYTGPSTSHQILGHELHHCFDGHFHDRH
jgi:hypothetical protein